MKPAMERQQIVTWYRPEEKLPPKDTFVAVTVRSCYDHGSYTIASAACNNGQWQVDTDHVARNRLIVVAWADLEPYGEDKI